MVRRAFPIPQPTRIRHDNGVSVSFFNLAEKHASPVRPYDLSFVHNLPSFAVPRSLDMLNLTTTLYSCQPEKVGKVIALVFYP